MNARRDQQRASVKSYEAPTKASKMKEEDESIDDHFEDEAALPIGYQDVSDDESNSYIAMADSPLELEEVSDDSSEEEEMSQQLSDNESLSEVSTTSELDEVLDDESDNEISDVESVKSESQGNTECTVCMETLPLDTFPGNKITASCKHNPEVCLPCLERRMES
jgi:hypothetical protein